MARISTAYVTNADQAKETAELVREGKPIYWPRVLRVSK